MKASRIRLEFGNCRTRLAQSKQLAILDRMAAVEPDLTIAPVLSPADIFLLRNAMDQIYMDEKIKRYIVEVVHATRKPGEHGLDIGPYIQYGASPRATIFLTRAAKGQAFLARQKNPVIEKPFVVEELLARIEQVLVRVR